MEPGTAHSIPVSLSAMLLPTTCWPSMDGLGIRDSMRWPGATVNNSQPPTPTTMGTICTTAHLSSAADSGTAVVFVLGLLWRHRRRAMVSCGALPPVTKAIDRRPSHFFVSVSRVRRWSIRKRRLLNVLNSIQSPDDTCHDRFAWMDQTRLIYCT